MSALRDRIEKRREAEKPPTRQPEWLRRMAEGKLPAKELVK